MSIEIDNSVSNDISEGIFFAKTDNTDKLYEWLKAGNNPNQFDNDGWTPLLWASARGHAESVKLLLDNKFCSAKVDLPHRDSEALPIHLAGQSGSVETSKIILDHKPDQINIPWDKLNGHTILLQAVFYGHVDLIKFLLERGADTKFTTARGLGAKELAAQFQNKTIVDLILPYDKSSEEKKSYYDSYLKRISPDLSEEDEAKQILSDKLVNKIEEGFKKAAIDPNSAEETLNEIKNLIEVQKADVNRLGGPLQQPPLIATVTGNNGFPPNQDVARLRKKIAKYLLECGADPTLHEKHPMGAQTIIRAAVFNHLDILKMCAEYITAEQLEHAINEIPLVNGLTAMHDTVLRATMATPDHFEGYLNQARWFVQNGGRSDIEDFSGVTQRNIAENAKDPEVRKRLLNVLDGKN